MIVDVVHLASTRYEGANHTHLSELLAEREGIDIGRTTMEATVDSELARIYRRGKLIKTHPRSWPRALISPSNTTQFSNPSDIGPSTYSVDVHRVDIQLGSLPSPQLRLHGSW